MNVHVHLHRTRDQRMEPWGGQDFSEFRFLNNGDRFEMLGATLRKTGPGEAVVERGAGSDWGPGELKTGQHVGVARERRVKVL